MKIIIFIHLLYLIVLKYFFLNNNHVYFKIFFQLFYQKFFHLLNQSFFACRHMARGCVIAHANITTGAIIT